MPFTLDQLAALRPYVYHLTARENLPRIQRTRALACTSHLLLAAGRSDILTARRRTHVPVTMADGVVLLRDQAPLHKGNMALEAGWTFEDFVRTLNDRVFFWPGGADGPIDYGRRHFSRYISEEPVLLRIPTHQLLADNDHDMIELCRFNSGSPRWNSGRASPRGPDTFVAAEQASFRPSNVVEVTVLEKVDLPSETEWGTHFSGPWEPL